MDFIWIVFAFGCGLGVRLLALPPLICYLGAGFLLNFLGMLPAAGLQFSLTRAVQLWLRENATRGSAGYGASSPLGPRALARDTSA